MEGSRVFSIFDRLFLIFALSLAATSSAVGGIMTDEYKGACDVSAVASIKVRDKNFFVVGDDEKNQLITYEMGRAEPVSLLNLDRIQDHGEMDIEGAATFGKYHLWMGSHGRNKNGEIAPSRAVFFTTVFENGETQQVGDIYRNLVEDMLDSPSMAGLPILEGFNRDGNYPHGFNIEGIASDQRQLLIGLRGPLVGDMAVVMFVINPMEVVLNKSKAEFSGFELLNLEGRGIRDLYFDAETDKFFIIAGPVADERGFSLYEWHPGSEPIKIEDISGDVTPEALFVSKSSHETPGRRLRTVHLLSDDGARNESKKRCNRNPEPKQRFRMFDVDLDRF